MTCIPFLAESEIHLAGRVLVKKADADLKMVVCDGQMATIELGRPDVVGLRAAVRVLREWQDDAAPLQLHPGDMGWHWQLGAEATAAAVRTWHREKQLVAIGLLDGARLLRLTTAPGTQQDSQLAHHLADDVIKPDRGVLPAGKVAVEAPQGALVMDLLAAQGWKSDDPWTPLRRDLADPVEGTGLRIETIGVERAQVPVAVHQSAFGSPKFTSERWLTMAAGFTFEDARCLVGFDHQGNAVAMVTVWSAGPGRPGLLEPMGVHGEHRGHGYGRAISVAAASALRELGSSSAMVCTPSDNIGAVATYEAAGFRRLPERTDRFRDSPESGI